MSPGDPRSATARSQRASSAPPPRDPIAAAPKEGGKHSSPLGRVFPGWEIPALEYRSAIKKHLEITTKGGFSRFIFIFFNARHP